MKKLIYMWIIIIAFAVVSVLAIAADVKRALEVQQQVENLQAEVTQLNIQVEGYRDQIAELKQSQETMFIVSEDLSARIADVQGWK
ncbi:MAG: hypothetical protein ACYDG4_10745 [Desulfuromonadaceae bacterium]